MFSENSVFAGLVVGLLTGCVTNEERNSSFQCCIKDESRSLTYAIQLEYVNHLKVLCSKGMVLNV